MTGPSEKQARTLWFALTGLAVAVVVGLVVAAFWGLGRILDLLSPVLWPLAIAAVVACLLSPVVDFFEHRKVPRTRAVLLVFAIALATLAAVAVSVIPQIVVETQKLAAEVPAYSDKLQARVNDFIAHPPELLQHVFPKAFTAEPATPDAPKTSPLAAMANSLTGSLPKMGSWLLERLGKLASGFGMLAGLVLVPVYAFHFLLEKRGIENGWKSVLPVRDSGLKDELVFVLEAISGYLVAFFRGQVLVALCDAVLYTIGFLLVGVDYAFLLGFAAIFLMMIPFLGAVLIAVTAIALAFVQYGDWQHPALVLGVIGLVQVLEGLFISPKIMGDRVGLHPLAILVAVMTGTTLLGGILGGILAIPLAAALRVIMTRYIWKK
ncbi:MAG TPA: AI-2E family transporter, partial [Verrucomicrobiae bacterium]